ncbi:MULTISPECIES: porin [unclassified Thioalkalivibrio]|uniref:porin n=1 Tax=unclassified Thioalkalivibrio TaxID=2621013 RepID=UPI000368D4D2|nr:MULTISPECIES: porin [unclassified Thioalkalivibrio]
MNRKYLLTSLIAAGLVVPALATADWTLYGRAHVSADVLDDGADYNEFNVSSNSSRLGFRGEREFREQLIGMFQIEQQVDFDTAADNELSFATRDTFVGLRGDAWGMLRVGKFDTPFKRARGPANFFGDQVGDLRNLARSAAQTGRFDERFNNSIHYQTPSFGGLTWNIQYSNETDGATTVDGADNKAYSTSLNLSLGDLTGALAYEKQEDGDVNPDAWRLAIGYRITEAFRIGGLYQNSETVNGDEADVYGLGGQLRLSPSMYLNGHVFQLDSDLDDADATMYALGLEYRIDSDLRFYGNIAMVDNDDASALTPWGAARSSGPGGAMGENATAFSLGMRYDF